MALSQNLKKKEMNSLAQTKTWNAANISSLPANALVLGERFGLVRKDFKTQNEVPKATFIFQRNEDSMKISLLLNVSVARQSLSKLIVSLSVIFGFLIFFYSRSSGVPTKCEKRLT